MKLALALPPMLVTSVRSACEADTDGQLIKPGGSEKDWDVACVTDMEYLFLSLIHI